MSSEMFLNKIKQLKDNLKSSMSITIKEYEQMEKQSRSKFIDLNLSSFNK